MVHMNIGPENGDNDSHRHIWSFNIYQIPHGCAHWTLPMRRYAGAGATTVAVATATR